MRSAAHQAILTAVASVLLPAISLSAADGDPPLRVAAVARDDATWRDAHARLNSLAGKDAARLVVLGDCAVAGWNTGGKAVWEEYYAKRGAVNLGVAEDCTENLLWRIENGNLDGCQPRLVVVQAGGTNLAANGQSAEVVVAGVRAIVDAVREKLPETQVLIVGVLPRGADTNDPRRLKFAELNRLVSGIADWEQVHFLDVGHALLEADGSLTSEVGSADGELTEQGYRRWAAAMDFKVAELLGEESAERVVLFDGKSLNGWQAADGNGVPRGWQVENGILKIVDSGDDAQTVGLYRDFDFQCEWRVEPKSNSGIFYRWADYGGIVSAGPEYQVTDDIGRKMPPDLDSATGATTDMYGPPADKPLRAAGEWNHTRIIVVEGEVEHWLNGIRLLSFDMASKDWRQRLAKSKFRRLWPFGRIYEGAFRLQNYSGSPASFRDITVTRL